MHGHDPVEAELIPTVAVSKLCEKVVIVMRQKICASSLTEAEKHEILTNLTRMADIDWAKECA